MNLSSGLLATKVIRNQGRQSLKLVFVQKFLCQLCVRKMNLIMQTSSELAQVV